MTRNDYLNKLAGLTDLKEKQLLIGDFWKDCAKRGATDVFTQNFLDNHVATLSDGAAKNIAKARSFNAANDFTSTLLAESSIKDLVSIINSDIIPWFVRNEFVFRNYKINKSIQSITIKVSAQAGGGVQTGERIEPVVGIDATGLVNHFHGSAEYARGDIFVKAENDREINWKKQTGGR
jgi:hypothetical protein